MQFQPERRIARLYDFHVDRGKALVFENVQRQTVEFLICFALVEFPGEMDLTKRIETPHPPEPIAKPRKRFVGTSASGSTSKTPISRRVANRLPADILLE